MLVNDVILKLHGELVMHSDAFLMRGLSLDEDSLKKFKPTVAQMDELAKAASRATRNWDDIRDGRGGDTRAQRPPNTATKARFAKRVAELHPMWKDLIDFCESQDYEEECFAMFLASKRFEKYRAVFQAIKKELKHEIFKRKEHINKGQNIPKKLSPMAFALRHAARELGLHSDSYDTLKTYIPSRKPI